MRKRELKAHQKQEEEKKEVDLSTEPEFEIESDCDSETGVKLDKIDLKEDGKQPKQFKGVMLAEVWTPDIDPRGYLMSEKLDGVRAIWNGASLYS